MYRNNLLTLFYLLDSIIVMGADFYQVGFDVVEYRNNLLTKLYLLDSIIVMGADFFQVGHDVVESFVAVSISVLHCVLQGGDSSNRQLAFGAFSVK